MAIIVTDVINNVLDVVNDLKSAKDNSFQNAIVAGSPRINDFNSDTTHFLFEGAHNGKLLPVLNNRANPNSFAFMDDNTCDTPECDVEIKATSYQWELGMIGCRVPICLANFSVDFMAWWGINKKIFNEEDVNSIVANYLRDKFLMNYNLAKYRVAYLGDKSSVSPYLANVNGFVTQMKAIPSQVVTFTQNAGANYTAQQNYTGLDVYNYLVAMDEKRLGQYWNVGAIEITMTELVARKLVNYLNGLKDKDCCDGIERLNADSIATRSFSIDNLAFRGMPIVVKRELDELINGNTALNGGGGNNARVNPNIIIMSYRENMLVGTPDEKHLDSFRMWYSEDENKIFMEAKAYLGAGVPLNDFIIAV